MQRAIDVYKAHLTAIVQDTNDRILAAEIPFYRDISAEVMMTALSRTIVTIGEDLENETPTAYPGYLASVAKLRNEQGAGLVHMLTAMDRALAAVTDMFDREFSDDAEPRLWWAGQRHRISFAATIRLCESLLAARDETIRAQTAQLHQLSVTIVPLHRGILLLPLVGTVDSKRAEQIMSVLLDAIVTRQSAVVIVDITGVPTVDTDVVRHLVQTAQATRLLGAEPVLVGINPQIAQTMVGFDVDLQGMTICGTLEDGMDYALGRLGKVITDGRPRRLSGR